MSQPQRPSQLNRLEARLQRLIEEGTSRLFASQDTTAALASQLIEAMQTEVQLAGADALQAPNTYTILAHPEHASGLRANTALLEGLASALTHAAAQTGIQIAGELVLRVAPQEGLAEGEFRVRAAGVGESLSTTQSLQALDAADMQAQIPAGAFLIVAGAEIFPLTQPIINIGRKNDNQLVIDNAQVSRRHAQLRAIAGHYHFFDLGSTGGSHINGVENKNAILLAGDVIQLAGVVPLIYGQDASGKAQETQEIQTSAQRLS
ncbi:MAG: DUF3662 domain-containing protein [Anaerolineales bacterium]|nr:DUF3662 domain-containing protein [Anaerolineales bacterium]